MTTSPSLEPSGAPVARRIAAAGLIALFLAATCCRQKPAPAPAPHIASAPVSPPPAPARADDAGYGLRPAERAAVDEFLRRNPDLRAAGDQDHRDGADASGVGALYGIYHPYFVRGDANDDGLLDFVLAFVRRDSGDASWFSIVVFSGQGDGTFAAGGFLEREISLADGDLSLDRDSIVVTPDVGEDVARRYRWDPARQRHVFVRDDDSEEPVSPPPSQI